MTYSKISSLSFFFIVIDLRVHVGHRCIDRTVRDMTWISPTATQLLNNTIIIPVVNAIGEVGGTNEICRSFGNLDLVSNGRRIDALVEIILFLYV